MNRFNNVIFGQKAFVVNDVGQVLILKRQKADIFTEYWDVPGGKVEEGDTLHEAIAREIKEEANLLLERVILQLSTNKFQGDVADAPIVMRNIYLCSASGEVKLSEEHSEFKWISPDELGEYTFPEDPDFQFAVAQLPTIMAKIDLAQSYSQIF